VLRHSSYVSSIPTFSKEAENVENGSEPKGKLDSNHWFVVGFLDFSIQNSGDLFLATIDSLVLSKVTSENSHNL
jgi:hypothetical protein